MLFLGSGDSTDELLHGSSSLGSSACESLGSVCSDLVLEERLDLVKLGGRHVLVVVNVFVSVGATGAGSVSTGSGGLSTSSYWGSDNSGRVG